MSNPSQPLYDVLYSGRAITGWCAGRTFADYDADRHLRRAIEPESEIIGEALVRQNRTAPEIADRIEVLPRIVGFRNRIIHGYDVITQAAVGGGIESHLPKPPAEIKSPLAI